MRITKIATQTSICALLALSASSGFAAVSVDTSALQDAVTVDGIRDHLQALHDIAGANGGVRASGTPGYDASLAYVQAQLEAAGYSVTVQPFEFAYFQELSDTIVEQIAPNGKVYAIGDDILTMEYSGSGDVTAPLQAVNDIVIPPGASANSSTAGCEAGDFAGFVPGNVALIQRGACAFALKAQNAYAAGASAVIIFNEGQAGRTETVLGTLGSPQPLPTVGASFDVGSELYALLQGGEVIVRVKTDTVSETRQTANLIAETAGGRDDRVVVAGAHLDSVAEGGGVQDNGSGSAAILEIALQMAELGIEPTNKVRFAWWGAEESGLVGSTYYVSQLSKRDLKNIALNLNFDMIASPNYVRFVQDGDGSDTDVAGPNGSANVEQVFHDHFASKGLPAEPTAFDGRSDYGPFIAVGIPAGGLFTGAEGVKTEQQAAIYGGTAGEWYDPCYHAACDDISNVNDQALSEMSDAAAHAVLTFAMTTSAVNGTGKASAVAMEQFDYLGSHLRK